MKNIFLTINFIASIETAGRLEGIKQWAEMGNFSQLSGHPPRFPLIFAGWNVCFL
jgi:hypothetical protein